MSASAMMQSSNGGASPSGQEPLSSWEDHRSLEMPNTDEEQELQPLPPNVNAQGQEEKQESLWSKYKTRILLGIICILLIIICILVAHLLSRTTGNQNSQAVPTGTLEPLNFQKNDTTCPSDWHGYKGYCYKLSENEKNWSESQNACILHNASLAKITEEERGTMRMLTRDHVFWIGLKREPNQPWKWLDGENVTWIKIMGNGGDCAFLDNDVTAISVRCITKHHYMCKKKCS